MNSVALVAAMKEEIMKLSREIAGETRHKACREVSLMIADTERKSLDMFSKVVNGLSLMVQEFHPMRVMKSIYDERKLQLMEKAETPTDMVETLRIVMDMEKRGIRFYRKAASETAIDRERRLFERLADEGEQHYTVLANSYFFMKNSESWYLWEEHSMVDGGTQWA